MSRTELTGLCRVPLMILDQAGELGLARDELLRVSGLAGHDLGNPDTRLPVQRILSLWRAIRDISDDPLVGLRLGAAVQVRSYGLVGYTMSYSRTLGEALDRFARYIRIVNEAIQALVRREKNEIHLVLDAHPALDALHYPVDARLAGVLTAAREITGVDIVPAGVHFPYRTPRLLQEYEHVFGAPLHFERPKAVLVLHAREMDLPVVQADRTLAGYLDRLAEEALDQLTAGETFLERVRRTIWADLPGGQPTLKRTARLLAVSPRTLQRRLRTEGTSYGEVLDSLRREMSSSLLLDRRLAVYEVAYLLGYAEPSTFYRAFRRWRGISPLRYRATAA